MLILVVNGHIQIPRGFCTPGWGGRNAAALEILATVNSPLLIGTITGYQVIIPVSAKSLFLFDSQKGLRTHTF